MEFGNDFARNVVIFGVDDNSSSHANNCKNNILVLGEEDTFGINRSFAPPEKSFGIYFIYFTWVFITMVIKVICLLMENKSLNLKPIMELLTFKPNFI